MAERLADEGIEAEVIDPATLKPLDIHTIIDSLEKTGRCVVVHEAARFGGAGAVPDHVRDDRRAIVLDHHHVQVRFDHESQALLQVRPHTHRGADQQASLAVNRSIREISRFLDILDRDHSP